MRRDKKILLFSDLEGTILRESDGKYDDEAMYNFLTQIDRLQQITGAEVNLHLVSPIYQKQMEEIIDKIDRNIIRYNMLHRDHHRIPEIECGTFTPDKRIASQEYLRSKTIPLKVPVDAKEFDTSTYGKANYVRSWCNMHKEQEDFFMAIYCGNGRNDLAAMDCVKQNKGFVVCPKNSRTLAKQKADFVSEKTDLPGITEGMANLNREIEKRIYGQPQENTQPETQEQ